MMAVAVSQLSIQSLVCFQLSFLQSCLFSTLKVLSLFNIYCILFSKFCLVIYCKASQASAAESWDLPVTTGFASATLPTSYGLEAQALTVITLKSLPSMIKIQLLPGSSFNFGNRFCWLPTISLIVTSLSFSIVSDLISMSSDVRQKAAAKWLPGWLRLAPPARNRGMACAGAWLL